MASLAALEAILEMTLRMLPASAPLSLDRESPRALATPLPAVASSIRIHATSLRKCSSPYRLLNERFAAEAALPDSPGKHF